MNEVVFDRPFEVDIFNSAFFETIPLLLKGRLGVHNRKKPPSV